MTPLEREDHWAFYEPTEEAPRVRTSGRHKPDAFVTRVYDDLVAHPGSSSVEIQARLGLGGRVNNALSQLKSSGRAVWTGARNSRSDPPRWTAT